MRLKHLIETEDSEDQVDLLKRLQHKRKTLKYELGLYQEKLIRLFKQVENVAIFTKPVHGMEDRKMDFTKVGDVLDIPLFSTIVGKYFYMDPTIKQIIQQYNQAREKQRRCNFMLKNLERDITAVFDKYLNK